MDKEVEPPPKKYYTIMWENKLTDEAVDRTIQQAENSSAENWEVKTSISKQFTESISFLRTVENLKIPGKKQTNKNKNDSGKTEGFWRLKKSATVWTRTCLLRKKTERCVQIHHQALSEDEDEQQSGLPGPSGCNTSTCKEHVWLTRKKLCSTDTWVRMWSSHFRNSRKYIQTEN